MLELAILGLLKERPMHGYELRKQLSQKLGFFWTVSFGSLYPTLRKLERRGVVDKSVPGDTSSRRKQVYSITASGEAEFLELLAEGSASAWEEEKFPLRLTFFRYLKPETRIRLLERRKEYLQDKCEMGRASLRRALDRRGERTDSYTVSLVRHGLDTTERDIAWLDGLIATEQRLLAGADPLGTEAPTGSAADARPPPHADTPPTGPRPTTHAPSEELQSQ